MTDEQRTAWRIFDGSLLTIPDDPEPTREPVSTHRILIALDINVSVSDNSGHAEIAPPAKE